MIQNCIKGKHILFFGLETMGYERMILDELNNQGAKVDYYSERPVASTLGKILIKMNPKVISRQTEKYYSKIINDHIGQKYDVIFVMKCDTPTRKVLMNLKKAFPKAELRLHLWDSLKNVPGIESKLDLFDRITSFDRIDCLSHPEFGFRPLFFLKEFENDAVRPTKYDMSFCGTIHTDRYRILNAISEQCEQHSLSFYQYYYLQSPLVFYYYRLSNKDYRHTKYKDFKYQALPTPKVNNIFSESSIIVDIQHPKQSGLTMRTIEALGAGKKLITTNSDIVNYDFYIKSNVCVIDRSNPIISEDFIKSEYVPIPKEIMQKYTLKQWVNDVINM